MLCKKCDKPLTDNEIEQNSITQRIHGWIFGWCTECWNEWGFYVFGEGRRHPSLKYQRKDGWVKPDGR